MIHNFLLSYSPRKIIAYFTIISFFVCALSIQIAWGQNSSQDDLEQTKISSEEETHTPINFKVELIDKDLQNPIGTTLHDALEDVVEQYENEGDKALQKDEFLRPWVDADKVAVEIFFNPSELPENINKLIALHKGIVQEQFNDIWLEAFLPLSALKPLASLQGIRVITLARLGHLNESGTGEGVNATRVNFWHRRAGIKGGNARMDGPHQIAVVDIFDANTLSRQQEQYPSTEGGVMHLAREVTDRVIRENFNTSPQDIHGNQVLEILSDLVPNIDSITAIHVDGPLTVGRMRAAIRNAADTGAKVISYSMGASLDGYNDGSSATGSVTEVLNEVADQNIFIAAAAGNLAESHWNGTFTDATTDTNKMDWTRSGTRRIATPTTSTSDVTLNKILYEGLQECIPPLTRITAGMIVDSRAPVTRNYALVLLRQSSDNNWYPVSVGQASGTNQRLVGYITRNSAAGTMLQGFDGQFNSAMIPGGQAQGCANNGTRYALQVIKRAPRDIAGPTQNSHINLFVNPDNAINLIPEYRTMSSSLDGSSTSSKIFTVGAVKCNTINTTLSPLRDCRDLIPEIYSGRGPVLRRGGFDPLSNPITSTINLGGSAATSLTGLYQGDLILPVKPDAVSISSVTTSLTPMGQPRFSGTSAAAPHVAAMAKLLGQRFPDLEGKPREMIAVLRHLAKLSLEESNITRLVDARGNRLYPSNPDNRVGYGLLRMQQEGALEWRGRINNTRIAPSISIAGHPYPPFEFMTMSPEFISPGRPTDSSGNYRFLDAAPSDPTQSFRYDGLGADYVMVRFMDAHASTRPVLFPSMVPNLILRHNSREIPDPTQLYGGRSSDRIPFSLLANPDPNEWNPIKAARRGYFSFSLLVTAFAPSVDQRNAPNVIAPYEIRAVAARAGVSLLPSGMEDRTLVPTRGTGLAPEDIFGERDLGPGFNVCGVDATAPLSQCPPRMP